MSVAHAFTLEDVKALAQRLATDMVVNPVKDNVYRLTALGDDIEEYVAWKEAGNFSPRTVKQYKGHMAKLAARFASQKIEEYDSSQLLAYIHSYPAGSRVTVHASLRDFWRWASLWKHIPDPMLIVPKPKKIPAGVHEIFSDDEEELILSDGPDRRAPSLYARDRAAILLLLRAGLRAGELLQMTVRDVNLAERTITVRRGKGMKGRIVPVRGDTVLALERLMLEDIIRVGPKGRQVNRPPLSTDSLLYPAFTNGDTILRSFPERPMAYSTFQKWWADRLVWAGVRHRKPHMARHTFATKMLRSGADIYRVQKTLGHSSINATTVYLHSDLRDLELAMDEMERKRGSQ